MRCLYVTQELAPFFAEGGLGQAGRVLPDVLARNHGMEHDRILPYYPWLAVRHELSTVTHAVLRPITVNGMTVTARVERLVGQDGPGEVFLLRADEWYDRGGIYRDSRYVEFADAAVRAAFFGACVAQWARDSGRHYDLVHGNDWQSGAALAHFRWGACEGPRPALLMNVHNGAYRGLLVPDDLGGLALPDGARDLLQRRAVAEPSLLLLGLLAADTATTGSPGYALELQEESLGTPVGDVLSRIGLTGIVAGVDVEMWNSGASGRVTIPYGTGDVDAGKKANKRLLQVRTGLQVDEDIPVFGVCARLVEEKGIDLVFEAMAPSVLAGRAQLVVIGPGDDEYRKTVHGLTNRAPRFVHYTPAFDQDLAWLAYAGGDFTLMPSRVEPCGLNQLIAMAYGTVPVVSAVGGLRDTVRDLLVDPASGTGLLVHELTAAGVMEAVLRAMEWLHGQRAIVSEARRRMMSEKWSWSRTAEQTALLYAGMTPSLFQKEQKG